MAKMQALATQILHELGRPEINRYRVLFLLKDMTTAGDDRPAWLERDNKITSLCLAYVPGLKTRKIGLLIATELELDDIASFSDCWEPFGEAIPDAWYDLSVCLKLYLESQVADVVGADNSTKVVKEILQDFLLIWKSRKSYSDAGKRMAKKLSDKSYENYKRAKPGRRITVDKESHFTRLAENWKRNGIPENLK